jgi:hypothetical protein
VSTLLTSWKEIAHYAGKSVRTVQRWEQELGFPIRRPAGAAKNVVIGVSAEIDDWVTSARTRPDPLDPELEEVRARLLQVQKENLQLQHQLQRLPEPPNDDRLFAQIQSLKEVVSRQAEKCNRLAEASSRLQHRSRVLMQSSHELRRTRYAEPAATPNAEMAGTD